MPRSKLFLVPRQPERLPRIPNNLPDEPGPLIGRAAEVQDGLGLLADPDVRLLTLVGPGGVGKTRLALRLAAEALEDFPGGVFLVELAAIGSPDLVTAAIARTLRVEATPPEQLAEALQAYLRGKRTLLLLDNFEHVLAAGGAVAELLAACPALKIMLTSRATLGLRQEHEFVVLPLGMPEHERKVNAARLARYGAVALFVERAGTKEADFQLTPENAAAVAEICRRVDGLPLAIELVAAHTRLLSPQSILARLTHPLRLLTGGPADAPRRQRTMRDTVEWSYSLLDAGEQRLFRALAVFAGGFAPRVAEVVCNAAGAAEIAVDDPLALEVLQGLEALIDKNLLRRATSSSNGDRRLTLLETVREYAWEQLQASGEAATIQRRHADYYVALAQHIQALRDGGQAALDLGMALEPEADNLSAAITWLLQQHDPAAAEDAIRLVINLDALWERRMNLSAMRRWLEDAFTQIGDQPTLLRSRALKVASGLARRQTDFVQAGRWADAALATAQALGDPNEIASAYDIMGGVALMQNDPARAGELSGAALQIYRELGAPTKVAITLNNLGMVALYQDAYTEAERYYQESLDILRGRGELAIALYPLVNLGFALQRQGRLQQARATFVEALELARDGSNPRSANRALAGLGLVIMAGLDPAVPNPETAAQATRLLALSEELRKQGGGHLDPRSQADFDRQRTNAAALLGAEFAPTWGEGATLDLDAAIELGRQELAAASVTRPSGGKRDGHPLTRRERDVTDLVKRGLSNDQIARQLVISERTVEMHVSHALHKLGLTTRTQLAAWAVEQEASNPPAD